MTISMLEERYYVKLLLSVIRGSILRRGGTPDAILNKDCFLDEEKAELLAIAEREGVKTHYFKRTNVLPRVRKVLGFLASVYPTNMLDVGSGRGAFLFPFIEEFPFCEVTSLELLESRAQMLADIERGGEVNLKVVEGDLCLYNAPDKFFDVVTILEVLEHIPNVKKAIANAVRLAKNYVVVTVPSEEDDNPEHIHLLTREKLTEYFNECGVYSLTFDGVVGHTIMIARIG